MYVQQIITLNVQCNNRAYEVKILCRLELGSISFNILSIESRDSSSSIKDFPSFIIVPMPQLAFSIAIANYLSASLLFDGVMVETTLAKGISTTLVMYLK